MIVLDRGLLLCQNCFREVTNGDANIMVDDIAYTADRRIKNLRVVCKACTRQLDEAVGHRRRSHEHNLWELYSVRDDPWHYWGRIMNEVMHGEGNGTNWDKDAVDAFVDILTELLPTREARGLLRSYFAAEEWDGYGNRSENFERNRSLGPDDRPDPAE